MKVIRSFFIYDTYMEPLVRVDVMEDGSIKTTSLKPYYGKTT